MVISFSFTQTQTT